MFTGIVEEVGRVAGIERGERSSALRISGGVVFGGLKRGDSIAVNGVCLTVTDFSGRVFRADVMGETLRRSSLGLLRRGSPVNLERAMAADGRFGGHLVSGHIDGTGIIARIEKEEIATWCTVAAPPKLLRYIVEKGSVAVDGVSLTVAAVTGDSFRVSLIPHTSRATALSFKSAGEPVNLETDMVGKYIERFLTPEKAVGTTSGGVTREFLAKAGFG
jgi:riboflavin synthase